MLDTLRHRIFVLTALLLLVSTAAVDLCLHGEAPQAEAAGTAALACDTCREGGEAGSEDETDAHCHGCLCACHAAGVLAVVADAGTALAGHPLSAPELAASLAGFRSRLERPPLAA